MTWQWRGARTFRLTPACPRAAPRSARSAAVAARPSSDGRDDPWPRGDALDATRRVAVEFSVAADAACDDPLPDRSVLGAPQGPAACALGCAESRHGSLSRQNGEATVAPLTPLRLSAHAVEKAKLSRLRVRDEVALLAAAEPVNATSPIAPALVAAKIAAPVRITVWRDVSFAMSQTPSLLTAFSGRQTTLARDFFRVRSRLRIDAWRKTAGRRLVV